MSGSVHYRIALKSAEAHLFDITVTVNDPAPTGQVFQLPAWIPGSYMIREFSRHIVMLSAKSAGAPVILRKIDKHTWQAAPVNKGLVVHYQVYAFDLSVRGAYLDTQRGFFNGASVFLMALGAETKPCNVEIAAISGNAYAHWCVATAMQPIHINKAGFGHYRNANYDELIDHPVEMGNFARVQFSACGTPHELVVSGRFQADLKRLANDVKKICEWQIRFFGTPAPFDRYVFMLNIAQSVYGGLEHRASSALAASRDHLPSPSVKGISDDYLQLLGLISHEYFHSWNIKRIKPTAFTPYDLTRENYTRLLWAFEGVTSYYDDLALVRCGLIDANRYLALLAKTITNVARSSGRTKQTLEEASYDAWTKYYRQDENSVNSLVSYYTKGSLVALALDLIIRRDSNGSKSLDDVMQALWTKWLQDGLSLAEDEWERIAITVSGLNLTPFFNLALRSTQELPLAELLATQGITLVFDTSRATDDNGSVGEVIGQRPPQVTLGIRAAPELAGIRLTQVLDGGAAQAAGLSGGDILIAIDHIKATDIDKQLSRFTVGDQICLHVFRRDELLTVNAVLQTANADTCRLNIAQHGARWLYAAIPKDRYNTNPT